MSWGVHVGCNVQTSSFHDYFIIEYQEGRGLNLELTFRIFGGNILVLIEGLITGGKTHCRSIGRGT